MIFTDDTAVFVLHCVSNEETGLPRRSSKRTFYIDQTVPGFAYQLRRGSLRSSLRFERRLVEAGGVEPPSGNILPKFLHTYPDKKFLSSEFLSGKVFRERSCYKFRLPDEQVQEVGYPA